MTRETHNKVKADFGLPREDPHQCQTISGLLLSMLMTPARVSCTVYPMGHLYKLKELWTTIKHEISNWQPNRTVQKFTQPK